MGIDNHSTYLLLLSNKKKIISNKPTNKKLPKTSITGTSLSGVIIGLAGIGMSILKKKKRED